MLQTTDAVLEWRKGLGQTEDEDREIEQISLDVGREMTRCQDEGAAKRPRTTAPMLDA